MSNPSENHKDVFAHFGLAAYHAQCYEMELKNIFLLLIRANNRSLSIPLLEQCEAVLDKQTLGTLIREIREVVSFDDGCAEKGGQVLFHDSAEKPEECFDRLSMNGTISNDFNRSSVRPEALEG